MNMTYDDPPLVFYWVPKNDSSYEEVFGNGPIDLCTWKGTNHRAMWNFLTGKEDEYIQVSGDNFYIDHNAIKGGLVIRTPEGDVPVPIGDLVFKTGNGLVGVLTLTDPRQTEPLPRFTEFHRDPDPMFDSSWDCEYSDVRPEQLN